MTSVRVAGTRILSPELKRCAISLAAIVAGASAVTPTFAADYIWTGGNYGASAAPAPLPATLNSTDILAITPTGALAFSGAGTLLTNNGTVNDTGASINFSGGANVNNAGTWDVIGSGGSFQDGGSGGSFTNTGTLENNSLSAFTITTDAGFAYIDNGGTLNAATAGITIAGGNASFTNTTFEGASGVAVTGAATFGGTITSSNNALQLQGATYSTTVAGAALSGTAQWSGGTVQGTWTINSGSTLTGTAGGTLGGGTITNNGTVNWATSGNLGFTGGTTLTNNGTFEVSGDAYLIDGGGAGGSFQNKGTFTNTYAGNIDVNTDAIFSFVDTNGTVNAANAAIYFYGGNESFTNTHFTGISQGDVITAGGTFAGTISSASNALSLQGGNWYSGATAATLSGSAYASGGAFLGTWTIASGTTLTNPGTVSIEGFLNEEVAGVRGNFSPGTVSTLTNNGTVDVTSSGYIYFNGGNLINNGLITVSNDAYFNDGGNGGTFENFGTLSVTSTVGTVEVNTDSGFGFINEAGGVISTAAGSTTTFNGPQLTFNDGSVFAGAGTTNVSGTATFNGKLIVNSGANLVLNGGTYTGAATAATPTGATLNGALTINGTLQGLWDFSAGSTVTNPSSVSIGGTGTTVTNNGTLDVTSSGYVYLNGGTLINNSLITVSNDAYFNDGGAGGKFENFGTLSVTSTVGTVEVNTDAAFAFTNEAGAVINTAAGSTTSFSGPQLIFNDGSVFAGAGTTNIGGTAIFNGKLIADAGSNLVLNGGTYTGAATVATPTGATINGALTWNGGTLHGLWDVAAGSSVTAVAGGNINGISTTVTNNGTVTWATAGNLGFENKATFVNNGVFNMTGFAYFVDAGGGGSFVNNGLLEKTSDTNTSTIGSAGSYTLVNNGVIQPLSGTLALGTFTNPGTLAGTAAFSANTLTNTGIVAPGTFSASLTMQSPGTLSLVGNYVQSSTGTLQIGLVTYQSAKNGLFAISGTGSLAGAIDVNCMGACNFSTGNLIEVLSTTAGLTGNVSSVVASGFSNNHDFTAENINGNEYLLVDGNITAAVPEPQTYALMLIGGGFVFAVVRRRSRQSRLVLAA